MGAKRAMAIMYMDPQGQPNRRTGICDSDMFTIRGGSNAELQLCGQNSGQHGKPSSRGSLGNRLTLSLRYFNVLIVQPEKKRGLFFLEKK